MTGLDMLMSYHVKHVRLPLNCHTTLSAAPSTVVHLVGMLFLCLVFLFFLLTSHSIVVLSKEIWRGSKARQGKAKHQSMRAGPRERPPPAFQFCTSLGQCAFHRHIHIARKTQTSFKLEVPDERRENELRRSACQGSTFNAIKLWQDTPVENENSVRNCTLCTLCSCVEMKPVPFALVRSSVWICKSGAGLGLPQMFLCYCSNVSSLCSPAGSSLRLVPGWHRGTSKRGTQAWVSYAGHLYRKSNNWLRHCKHECHLILHTWDQTSNKERGESK